jgi:hypothetical protein
MLQHHNTVFRGTFTTVLFKTIADDNLANVPLMMAW